MLRFDQLFMRVYKYKLLSILFCALSLRCYNNKYYILNSTKTTVRKFVNIKSIGFLLLIIVVKNESYKNYQYLIEKNNYKLSNIYLIKFCYY